MSTSPTPRPYVDMDDYLTTPRPNQPWWKAHTGRTRPGKLSEVFAQAVITKDEFEAELDRLLEDALRKNKRTDRPTPFSPAAHHYLATLPPLASRRDVQLHLAAVVRGFQTGLIEAPKVKLLLYSAQLALAAFGVHNEGPPPTPARAQRGFTE